MCDVHFNSVLVNLYRNGDDYMGWHSDNEKELGVNPVIAR
ncbi:alkylated DNA repair protein alkB [Vibrio ishigakensis]|uniref:Alkylated DNA repair protein alkB n=1 Tax=Vibrio ishigakensis TaxID=1481914 RepID=A0A0B8P6Q3_9VIBR|nr:alkylated DNA repair protein alkB [Vibrio ishigakensis]